MQQLKISKQITNRDSPCLDKYLQEIGRISLLVADEEVELARCIQEGNAIQESDKQLSKAEAQALRKSSQQALDKLVKANLRFVVSVAKQYQNQGLPLIDLINEGNIGLMKAAVRFDPTRGFKFISYAVWWVRQSILQALAEQARIVRLPLNRVSSVNRVCRTYSQLEQEYQREPTNEEIAEVLDITPAEVSDTRKVSGKHISVDAPFVQGEENTMLDTLSNTELEREAPHHKLTHDESLRIDIKRSLSILSKREATVLSLSLGIDSNHTMTLEEIGAELGLTRERVRQIREKSIQKIRHSPCAKVLKSYL